jgi:hypothetical protein
MHRGHRDYFISGFAGVRPANEKFQLLHSGSKVARKASGLLKRRFSRRFNIDQFLCDLCVSSAASGEENAVEPLYTIGTPISQVWRGDTSDELQLPNCPK